jgi:hypothetical protein
MKKLSLVFALSLLTLSLCADQENIAIANTKPNYDLLMSQCNFILSNYAKRGDVYGVFCYESICEYLKKQNTADAFTVLSNLVSAGRLPTYEFSINGCELLGNQALRNVGVNPIVSHYY